MKLDWKTPLVFLLAAAAPAAAGSFTIEVQPASQTVLLGQNVSILLLADFPENVVGWGLDLTRSNPPIVTQTGAPSILSPWIAASGIDGDGLSALASPFPPTNGSISGLAVPLATINFTTASLGTTDLLLSFTPGDLTEGVALDPTGFASVQLFHGQITVIPEPTASLFIAALTLTTQRRRRPNAFERYSR